jgi:hypothetical protein
MNFSFNLANIESILSGLIQFSFLLNRWMYKVEKQLNWNIDLKGLCHSYCAFLMITSFWATLRTAILPNVWYMEALLSFTMKMYKHRESSKHYLIPHLFVCFGRTADFFYKTKNQSISKILFQIFIYFKFNLNYNTEVIIIKF